ncbi:MAG: vWA domain-containing protein, partial [Actinomycetota bacterium]
TVGRRVLMVLVGIALMTPVFAPAAVGVEADDEPTATVVVLVDLSGSLRQRDIADEIRAAGVMNTVPGIDLYVIGFASEGSLPATVVVCEPGDDLTECTAALGPRSNSQGNDTDHAAALEAAAEVLGPAGSDDSPPRIVLLLTDGEFDPSGSGNPTADELAGLSDALDSLRASDTSVWPLGFGRATKAELDALAVAAPGSCKEARGVLVSGSEEIPTALSKIIGQANCAETVRGDQLVVRPDTGLVVVTYGEDELPDATVTVLTDSRDRGTFDCVFDDVAGVWTCEIPTESLGAGKWKLEPPPRQYPTPYQQQATTPETTTTTVTTPSTTTSSIAETTTTQPLPSTTVATEAVSASGESGGFPWAVIVLGLIGLAGVGGAALWSRRN